MLKKLDKQKKLIIVVIAIVAILGIVKMIDNNYQSKEDSKTIITEDKQKFIEEKETEETIIVYITGEVNSQGVIKLASGSRIVDAIEKAGGLTNDANIKNINLAYELEDGEKIYIPNINEPETVISDDSERNNHRKNKRPNNKYK